MHVLQLGNQIVNKENDANREKMVASQKMGDLEREHQQLVELRIQTDNLKDANALLQREITTLHEVISEQKVRLRRVVVA